MQASKRSAASATGHATGIRGPLPLHPFLLALVPVLFVFARNVQYLDASLLIVPTGAALAGTLLAFVAWDRICRERGRAAVLTSFCLLLFFTYGNGYAAVLDVSLGEVILGRHRYVMLGWGVVLVIGCRMLLRARTGFAGVTRFLNAACACLVILNAFPIVAWAVTSERQDRSLATPLELVSASSPGGQPDIYYLILDGYAGPGVLREMYGHDNEPFLTSLEARGFFVARGSHSNYSTTGLSLPSSLNMAYLRPGPQPELYALHDAPELHTRFGLVQRNRVARLLKSRGYRFIHLGSTWGDTFSNVYADLDIRPGRLNEFTRLLLQGTALGPFMRWMIQSDHRAIRLYQFRALARLAAMPGPKFTFAHIVCPHPPFVFDREGRPVAVAPGEGENEWHPQSAYLEQLLFLNGLVEDLVDTLLAQPGLPPVIVLQGDHGPASTWPLEDLPIAAYSERQLEEKTAILNAYALPGTSGLLYDSISPVNTFRVIFNAYFGTEFPLLEDVSYASTSIRMNDLMIVQRPRAGSD